MRGQETHPALSYACPFCGADPGTPCRAHRGRGYELDRLHSRRTRLANPLPEISPHTALCCECGATRAFREARNVRGYWGDLNWHRNVCDLKCCACDRVTTHAMVGRDGGDEVTELVARGIARGVTIRQDAAERLQAEYRRGLPRNPHLTHRYWFDDARAARTSGATRISALCGEPIPIGWGDDGEPESLAERPEPGSDWERMPCVDCLNVSNENRRRREREQLQRLTLELCARLTDGTARLGDGDIAEALENIRKLLP